MKDRMSALKKGCGSSIVSTVLLSPTTKLPEQALGSPLQKELSSLIEAMSGLTAHSTKKQLSSSPCHKYKGRNDMDAVQGKILIVEDDTALRRSLHSTLSMIGFDIGEAGNGEEALM